MIDRLSLPNRRNSVTVAVPHKNADGSETRFTVTFGFWFGPKGYGIRECFCSSPKSGSDMQAFINDSCIAISLLLQCGMTMKEIGDAFGENRQEGAESGPPSSPLGAIARSGVALESGPP